MKKFTAVFLMTVAFVGLIGVINANAQQRIVEKTLSAGSGDHVKLNLQFGEHITIKGWDKNEVSFRAVVEINSGKLNDAFIANYVEDNQGIRIETDFDKEKLEGGRRSDCPKNNYSSYSWNDGKQFVCSKIQFEVFVPRNSDLELETISADIELFDLDGPIDAQSISGFVDLSWPEMNGADISMETVTGEAYSNFDNLTFNNKQEELPMVGYELRGAIGSGGPKVRLESVSGDVYLRKREG